jgi:hypothetical protein
MEVVGEFKRGNYGFDKINRSYLFLLPEKPGADNFPDFRSITLSNSIYLLVSKVLATRLRFYKSTFS